MVLPFQSHLRAASLALVQKHARNCLLDWLAGDKCVKVLLQHQLELILSYASMLQVDVLISAEEQHAPINALILRAYLEAHRAFFF
jgi:dTDP-4-dehydrorhamnose reductase